MHGMMKIKKYGIKMRKITMHVKKGKNAKIKRLGLQAVTRGCRKQK